jgi:hypothetical protein
MNPLSPPNCDGFPLKLSMQRPTCNAHRYRLRPIPLRQSDWGENSPNQGSRIEPQNQALSECTRLGLVAERPIVNVVPISCNVRTVWRAVFQSKVHGEGPGEVDGSQSKIAPLIIGLTQIITPL